jgi:N-acetylmuramoyl-L-alanine amidase
MKLTSFLRPKLRHKTLCYCTSFLVLACSGVLLAGCETQWVPVFTSDEDIKSVKDLKPPQSHMDGRRMYGEEMAETTEAEALQPSEESEIPVAVATEAPEPLTEMAATPAPAVQTWDPALVETRTATMQPENLALPPPTDYNPKNIFGKNLRTDGERLDRLERALQDLRNEFDSVRPSVIRLVAVERDIQSLISELKKLSQEPGVRTSLQQAAPTSQPQIIASNNIPMPSQPVATPKRTTQTNKTYQNKTPPPVSNGQASVFDVRVGEHPGRTRIVLDTNAKTDFNVDIDNSERIMVIDLPSANWTAAMARSFGKSPIISSYKVEPSGNGHLLIFQLKAPANLASKSDIGGPNGGRRIVLDIAK